MSAIETYLDSMVSLRATMPRSKDLAYSCFEEFVRKHGKLYEQKALTDEERTYVTFVARGLKFPIKMCFFNSQSVLLQWDLLSRLRYVEGYATGIIPVFHGWLTINGKVIDFTMRERDPEHGPIERAPLGAGILGTWSEPREYFGVEFPTEMVRKLVKKRGLWAPVLDDPEYRFPLLRKPWKGTGHEQRRRPIQAGHHRR